MKRDPVCGMHVDEKEAITMQHEGKTYHFCSPACKAAFEKEPRKYIEQ